MASRFTAVVALGAFVSVAGLAVPAQAADVRPGVVAVSGTALGRVPMTRGRAGAPTQGENKLIGGVGGFAVGALALGLGGFAVYKGAKGGSSPKSP